MGSDTFTDKLKSRIYNNQIQSLLHDLAFQYDGINRTGIRKLLDANKKKVIKGILKLMIYHTNENIMEDLDYIFNNLMPVLDGLDLRWPELDAIKKSWQADAEERMNRDDLNEAAKVSNMTPKRWQKIADHGVDSTRHTGRSMEMRYMVESLLSSGAPPAAVDDLLMMNIDVLTHAIVTEMQDGYLDSAFATMIFMKRFDKTRRSLLSVFENNMDIVKKSMLKLLDYQDIVGSVGLLNSMRQLGIDEKMIKSLKADVGPKIIEAIKKKIGSHGFNRGVFDALSAMEYIGIKPSIGAGKIRDRLLSDFNQTLMANGMMAAGWQSESNANVFIKIAIRYGDADTLDKMKGIIEKNKDQVIRTMLQAFKRGSEYSIYPALSSLQNLGFKWPELAIIDKSIKSMPGAR